MKKNPVLYLAPGESISPGRSGGGQQRENARWQVMLAIKRNVPEVFDRLHTEIYPAFAREADQNPRYWQSGWTFASWQFRSDSSRQMTPLLMDWARRFHLEKETWILEGALETLKTWHKIPRCREDLEILGFRHSVCVSGLIAPQEYAFHFKDEGWDATMLSFGGWRLTVQRRFEQEVREYGQRMRALLKARGGKPAVLRASKEHFDWLALYQCAGASLETMQKRFHHHYTSISKGMRHAAELAGMSVREKRR